LLGADRIDHGVRATEDPSLVALLAERAFPLGICPTSNLVLRVYASLNEHPVGALRCAGVQASLNTDAPSLLATCLPREYEIGQVDNGWGDAALREIASTSIAVSLANSNIKTNLWGKPWAKMLHSRYLRKRSFGEAKGLLHIGGRGVMVALADELAGAGKLKPSLEVFGNRAVQQGALGVMGSICFRCKKSRFGFQHWRGGPYRRSLISLGFQPVCKSGFRGVKP